MPATAMGRRGILRTAGGLALGSLAAPFVRGAHAAGGLSVALWQHPVPGADAAVRRVIADWAEASRIDVRIDFITADADRIRQPARAEARARVGHDLVAHPGWQIAVHHRQLEPLDELVADIEAEHGPVGEPAASLARIDGIWRGVPTAIGAHAFPMISRLDLYRRHLDLDLRQVFPPDPAGRREEWVGAWTWEAFFAHAALLRDAGCPFVAPLGAAAAAQNWLAPLFLAFGSVLVTARGEIAVDSEATRAALEYLVRLVRSMPEGIERWDGGESDRRLSGGRAATIVDRPVIRVPNGEGSSDPQGAEFWHHGLPRGPGGRYRAVMPFAFGIWEFATNKAAARALARHLARGEVVRSLAAAAAGHDLPQLASLGGPEGRPTVAIPAGPLANYPIGGDEMAIVPGYPAPARIAATIFEQRLIGQLAVRAIDPDGGVEQAVAWARRELEAYISG
ncbi:ABC transporter substrate-binding protein [Allostella sp. ATCC 35155]|nr:ABC transporter substrate-binding protein [Stella sp. ATCC 35155]